MSLWDRAVYATCVLLVMLCVMYTTLRNALT